MTMHRTESWQCIYLAHLWTTEAAGPAGHAQTCVSCTSPHSFCRSSRPSTLGRAGRGWTRIDLVKIERFSVLTFTYFFTGYKQRLGLPINSSQVSTLQRRVSCRRGSAQKQCSTRTVHADKRTYRKESLKINDLKMPKYGQLVTTLFN